MSGSDPDLYLASGSPRRRELLQRIGVKFERLKVEVDESVLADELPRDYVTRLALAKARAGWQEQQRLAAPAATSIPVLGADTTVVIDQRILGKPTDRADGISMLRLLSNRQHEVLSGVAIICSGREAVRVNSSRVTFRPLSDSDCAAYWATGEPADKAGAYAIQGLGETLVRNLEGSHSGVMGLPLLETAELLAAFDIDLWRKARP